MENSRMWAKIDDLTEKGITVINVVIIILIFILLIQMMSK